MNQGTKHTLFQDAGGVVRYLASEHTTFDLGAGIAHLVDHGQNLTRTGPYVKAGVTHRAERATKGALGAPPFGAASVLGDHGLVRRSGRAKLIQQHLDRCRILPPRGRRQLGFDRAVKAEVVTERRQSPPAVADLPQCLRQANLFE